MDNLTHTLVGVLLSRAGLNRVVPQAGWLLVAAANAPDADIISGLWSNTTYLDQHRGWTHSLSFIPAVALLALAFWLIPLRRKRIPRSFQLLTRGWLVAGVGVLSHHLLDLLNTYAIRLFLPFKQDWYHLDLLNVIDLWVWAILLIASLGPILSRLVSSEIGARASNGRLAAYLGLVLLMGYVGWRAMLHQQALAALNSRMHVGHSPIRVAAFPGPVNPWLWRGVAETRDLWRIYSIDLRQEFDPDQGRSIYKPEPGGVIPVAASTPSAASFLRFALYPVWQVTPAPGAEGGSLVTITDLRFGLPGENRFTVQVQIDPSNRPISDSFNFGTTIRTK